MSSAAALVALTLSRPALAAAAPEEGRWRRHGRSLVWEDASGEASREYGLGRWEEGHPSSATVRELRGGTAASGRFAWLFSKKRSWAPATGRVLDERGELRYLGTAGRELWKDAAADAPEGLEPAVLSEDGETVLELRRGPKGWSVAVRGYLGTQGPSVGPFPRLDEARLTANGRYALIRWRDPDLSATHTALDARDGRRRDLPSADFPLGRAVLTEDGKVLAGGKVLHDFAAGGAP